MILGPQIDMVQAIGLRGMADVYERNGQRIVRKWPKVVKQPRTQEQTAHWALVKKAAAWRKALPGWWLSGWKGTVPPPNFTWNDVLMRAWWAYNYTPDWNISPTGPNIRGWWKWYDEPAGIKYVGIELSNYPDSFAELIVPYYLFNSTGTIIQLKWTIYGWKCYPGKKKRPLYNWDHSDWSPELFLSPQGDKAYSILYTGQTAPLQVMGRVIFSRDTGEIPWPGSPIYLITEFHHVEF